MPRDLPTTETLARPARKRRTIGATTTNRGSSVASFETALPERRERTIGGTISRKYSSAPHHLTETALPERSRVDHVGLDIQLNNVDAATPPRDPVPDGCDVGHVSPVPHCASADVAFHVARLRELGRRRQLCIAEANGFASRIEHLLAQVVGYQGTERSKREAFAQAHAHRSAVERAYQAEKKTRQMADQPVDWRLCGDPVLVDTNHMVVASFAARQIWVRLREDTEGQMEEIAKRLPGRELVEATRGFGWLAFAVLQSWCVDPIGEYRTVAGLWKRLGVAVVDGRRQRGVSGKRDTAEDRARLFYPKRARADVYAFLSDTMFRHQWAGPRLRCACAPVPRKIKANTVATCDQCGAVRTEADVVPAHATGPYGDVYGRRRAHTARRVEETADLAAADPDKWTPLRCKNDALRVMSKALLRDLWRAANGLPPRKLEPTTEQELP